MQRQFEIENEKDMQDLWDILPDNIESIEKKDNNDGILLRYENGYIDEVDILKINWHDKTEITRPIQEATFDDVGKLCIFWDEKEKNNFGILEEITSLNNEHRFWKNNTSYKHCRRLTKQEIKEMC